MSKVTQKSLGEFEIVSGKVRISDPCYDKDTRCAGTLKNVQKGKWEAFAHIFDEGGGRVGYLVACVKGPEYQPDSHCWKDEKIDVGVDSGQCGIYDEKFFKDDSVFKDYKKSDRKYKSPICIDEPWYSWNCDLTLSKESAGVIPYGCVSSSGYGDGSYVCKTIKQGNKIVAIMIDYGLARV